MTSAGHARTLQDFWSNAATGASNEASSLGTEVEQAAGNATPAAGGTETGTGIEPETGPQLGCWNNCDDEWEPANMPQPGPGAYFTDTKSVSSPESNDSSGIDGSSGDSSSSDGSSGSAGGP